MFPRELNTEYENAELKDEDIAQVTVATVQYKIITRNRRIVGAQLFLFLLCALIISGGSPRECKS